MRSRAPIERQHEPSHLRTTRSSIPGPAHLSGAGVYADKSFATPDVERESGCGDLEAGEGRVAGADRQVAVVAQNDRLGSGTTPSRRGSPLSRVQCQRPSVPGKISYRFETDFCRLRDGSGSRTGFISFARGTDSSNPFPSSGESVSLQILPSFLEKPGFCAGMATRPGSTVGRDAQGSSTSRQLPVMSLSGAILVPQCRLGGYQPGCTGTKRGRVSDVTKL